jgi:hypothetical protein
MKPSSTLIQRLSSSKKARDYSTINSRDVPHTATNEANEDISNWNSKSLIVSDFASSHSDSGNTIELCEIKITPKLDFNSDSLTEKLIKKTYKHLAHRTACQEAFIEDSLPLVAVQELACS